MQGHTYALIGILAADGLAGLFVAILRVSLTCTCMYMLVSLTMRSQTGSRAEPTPSRLTQAD